MVELIYNNEKKVYECVMGNIVSFCRQAIEEAKIEGNIRVRFNDVEFTVTPESCTYDLCMIYSLMSELRCVEEHGV